MAFIANSGALPIRNTSAVFISTNPIFLYGQMLVETDTNRTKIGDGASTYTDLTYSEWGYEIVEAAGTNTYTGTFSKPQFLVYFPMQEIRVRFTNANTGAATINLNGFGAKAIKKQVSAALVAGDIIAGSIHLLFYDGTNFQIQNGVGTAGIVPTLAQVLAAGNSAAGIDIINLNELSNTVGNYKAFSYYQSTADYLSNEVTNSALTESAQMALSLETVGSPFASMGAATATWNTSAVFRGDNILLTGTKAGFDGAIYAADYSANFVTRSLIDKGYADATYYPIGGIVPLSQGGTNANLTASLGGIFYSTGTAGAILSGTATAGQMLRSGASAAPTWSTNVWPNTTPINQILYATAANVIGGSTTLLTDGTYLIVGATALVTTEIGSFQKAQNAGTLLTIYNSTSGTASYTGFSVLTNGIAGLNFQVFSPLYTTSGLLIANSARFRTDSPLTGGLLFIAGANAPLIFATNDVERFRVLGANGIQMNQTTFSNAFLTIKSLSANNASILLTDNVTNSGTKVGMMVAAHYTNAEEPMGMITGQSGSAFNQLSIGGGYAAVNAPTHIQFYMAANNTTTTGTEVVRFTPEFNFKFGGTANRATTVGSFCVDIFNGTAPVGTLANGVSLFSASGILKTADAAGVVAFVLASSAVTTEVVVSDTTLTVKHNGTTYKILARA